jgi:hypothetical protein
MANEENGKGIEPADLAKQAEGILNAHAMGLAEGEFCETNPP